MEAQNTQNVVSFQKTDTVPVAYKSDESPLDIQAPFDAKKIKTEEQTGFVYAAWAFYVVKIGMYPSLSFTIAGIIHSHKDPRDRLLTDWINNFYTSQLHLGICYYTLGVSLILLCIHQFWKQYRKIESSYGALFRLILYVLLSLPMHITMFTRTTAWVLTGAAALYFLSYHNKEKGDVKTNKKKTMTSWITPDSGSISLWWEMQLVRGAVARIVLFILWILIQAYLYYYKYKWAVQVVEVVGNPKYTENFVCWSGQLDYMSQQCIKQAHDYATWLPIAKGSGLCLDFNISLVVLMMIQGLIRELHSCSMKDGIKFYLFGWMPLHKTLLFHKVIAWAIMIHVCLHGFGHHMSHSYSLAIWKKKNHVYSILFFNWWHSVGVSEENLWAVVLSVWATGYILTILIVFMYALAEGPVRNERYELFFNFHIFCAIAMFLLLFWHSTEFYKWGLAPFCLYLLDRYRRSRVGAQMRFALMKVIFQPPVMGLTFRVPFKYQAGEYARLLCPMVSELEYHPFTISSAYESSTVSFHIKCFPGGWTERVCKFLEVVVHEANERGEGRLLLQGKGWGWEFITKHELDGSSEPGSDKGIGLVTSGKESRQGLELFRIDGPHSAPCSNYSKHRTVVMSAAGIGLTPLVSVVTTCTSYYWGTLRNLDLAPSERIQTQILYGVWCLNIADCNAYQWFVEQLEYIEHNMKGISSYLEKTHQQGLYQFEMHIFISVRGAKDLAPFEESDYDYTQSNVPPSSAQIMHGMKNPLMEVAKFTEVMNMPLRKRSNRLGCTHIWQGSQPWNDIYARVRQVKEKQNKEKEVVGVFFCGPHGLSQTISQAAIKASIPTCLFNSQKENF